MSSYPKVSSLAVAYDKVAGKILLEAVIASENPIEFATVEFGVQNGNGSISKSGDEYGNLFLDLISGTWKGYYLVSPELAESGTLSLLRISATDTLLQNTIYRNNDANSRPLREVNIRGEIGNDYIFRPGISNAVVETRPENNSEGIIDVSELPVSTGTGGRDLFFFRNPYERDTITNFSSEDGDLIALSITGFEGISKISFKSAKNSKKIQKLETKKANIIYDYKKGVIYYNSNGKDEGLGKTGGAIAFFEERPKLSAADFILTDITI